MEKKYDISKQEIREWIAGDSDDNVRDEDVEATEDALIRFAEAHAVTPPAFLKSAIINRIRQLPKGDNDTDVWPNGFFPWLDETADWRQWQQAVADINPPSDIEDIYMHTLESNEDRDLFIAWVKKMVPEEVHYDILESFILLEGSCECHITDEQGHTRIVRMGQGDFITMKLGEVHDIVITSDHPAKAILQWKKLAA